MQEEGLGEWRVEIGERWKRLWEEGEHPVCVLDRREDTLRPLFPGQKSAKSSCIKSTYKANKLELALCHFNLADLARDKNAENPSMNHHFIRCDTTRLTTATFTRWMK
ncbi:uncharacterized protein LOC116186841 [Apis dorsata]|uniref:uncharacterized protein LOC116186841 n=1 Tax=Apis dorsata TaxID=7462 RepID=UPI001293D25E|nr:uncharacterized protein LOC116186841 [Apis dorsata]